MFDQQQGGPPPNLPTEKVPEDIFSNSEHEGTSANENNQTSEIVSQRPTQAKDSTSGGIAFVNGQMTNAPSALDVGKIKPVQTQTHAEANTQVNKHLISTEQTRGADAEIQESFFSRHKVLLVGLIVLIILIPVIWGGTTLFLRENYPVSPSVILKESETENTVSPQTTEIIEPSVTPEKPSVLETATTTSETNVTTPESVEKKTTAQSDIDGDGLSEVEEVLFGTDVNKSDTDGDGLTDKEEINIWKTDPLKLDSDGDTFNDGQEIKNGYNPLGSGRLFGIPKQ